MKLIYFTTEEIQKIANSVSGNDIDESTAKWFSLLVQTSFDRRFMSVSLSSLRDMNVSGTRGRKFYSEIFGSDQGFWAKNEGEGIERQSRNDLVALRARGPVGIRRVPLDTLSDRQKDQVYVALQYFVGEVLLRTGLWMGSKESPVGNITRKVIEETLEMEDDLKHFFKV